MAGGAGRVSRRVLFINRLMQLINLLMPLINRLMLLINRIGKGRGSACDRENRLLVGSLHRDFPPQSGCGKNVT